MKIPLGNLLLMVICLHSFYGYSQNGEYDIRLVQIDYSFDPCTQSGKTSIDIEVKANADTTSFFIADQNYRLTIDTTTLQNPTIKQEFVFSGMVSGPGYTATYEPHNLQGSLGDIVSYNVVMTGGSGYPVNHLNYIKIGQIEFDVIKDTTSVISWKDDSGFPESFIVEVVGGIGGTLEAAKGVEFEHVVLDSLAGAPIPQRISQNGHVCAGQLGEVMEYSVINGTFYDFMIIPPTAGLFLQDSNGNTNSGVNVAFVEFTDGTLDSAKIVAGKTFGCGFFPHLEWTVYFDNEGVYPGDVNNDGFVNWSQDATSQMYALATMFEEQQANPGSSGIPRPEDRINNITPYQFEEETFEFGCHYSEEWKDNNGNNLTFSLNGEQINMKHADSNGDGVLLTQTSTENYLHAAEKLSTISGGPLDADIIARYHFLKTSSGESTLPAGASGSLHIQSLDSIMEENKDLRLKVDLGETNVPVEQVQSIGFIAEFTYGRFKNPELRLDSTYLGNPNNLIVSDYPILPDTSESVDLVGNPKWFVAIGRPNLTGVDFKGEEVCRITCEVTIAGLQTGEGSGVVRSNPPDSITIYLRDVVIIKEDGNALSYPGDSIRLKYKAIVSPVTLAEFSAENVNDKIELFWRTETEVDFDKFELRRSYDNENFIKIASVRGVAGIGSGAIYNYTDTEAQLNNNVYYMLKMIDLNGSSKFSDAIVVKLKDENFSFIDVRPNPVSEATEITFESLMSNEPINIRLFNTVGQQVYWTLVSVKQGVNKIPLQLKYYPDGIYQLHISQGSYKVTRKLVKINK